MRELTISPNKSSISIAKNIRSQVSLFQKNKFTNLSSRVLLVKGLEFETVVLVNPENLTYKEFYVGISRPTERLIIISKNRVLNFFDK